MANVFIQGVGGGGVKLATLSNPASASDVFSGYEGYDDTGTLIQGTYTTSNPTLSAPTISISSSTLTITDSANNGNFTDGFKIYVDGVLTATQSASTYDLSGITDAGTYAIRVKAYATDFNDSALSNEVSYTVSASARIYGVSGLAYNSNATALTRTDDAVGMTWTMSNNEISSDFDNVFPYNEMVRTTIGSNVFVKIPAMWWRIGYNNSNLITDIAVSNAQMEAGTNQVVVQTPEFYYGAYGAYVSSYMYSVSGQTRTGNLTRISFRSTATLWGAGYSLIDVVHTRILEFLWLIEFATRNSEDVMWGYTGFSGTTGATDNLTSPSGQLGAQDRMRYRYIEDFVGNGKEFFDGIYGVWVTDDASKYANSAGTGWTSFSIINYAGSNDELACMGIVDMNDPFLAPPGYTVQNSNYNTYYCDQIVADNACYFYARGRNSNLAGNGLFHWQGNASSTWKATSIGSRLLYVPQS